MPERVSHLSLYFEGSLPPEKEQELVQRATDLIKSYGVGVVAVVGGVDNLEADH